MKSILDPSFRYVSAKNTDLRKTFARIKKQQKEAQQHQQQKQPQMLRRAA